MPRRNDTDLLRDMIDAASDVETFIAGRARADLDTDKMLLYAVVRALEIFGEAASQLSNETRGRLPDIPWRDIVGMRNRIVHAYTGIDADIVWRAVREEIPELLPAFVRAVAATNG